MRQPPLAQVVISNLPAGYVAQSGADHDEGE
jgi:hypothetical protein